jgi:hypothetical protein
MFAQSARVAIVLVAIVLSGLAFLTAPGLWGWPAMIAVFLAGGIVAEMVFRRLATPDEIRADLEDRAPSSD